MKIAITGTKGKTTIMYLIKHVLRSLNKNVIGVSSTEGIFYNEEFLYEPRMSRYLVRKFDRPYDYQVSEATSKLLKYGKYTADDVDIALFNGIEKHEHLETHQTFFNYLTAKKILFDLISGQSKIAIVNQDDAYHTHILKDYKGQVNYIGTTDNATYKYTILEQQADSMRIKIDYFTGSTKLLVPFSGKYNAQNTTMAFVSLIKSGISIEEIVKHLQTFPGVPGRFQKIELRDGRLIIIDYAHSEESLQLVLNHIKEVYPERPIITVFGCGGDRASQKRPQMGKVATEESKFVYITRDNPRSEQQSLIFNDIVRGIKKSNFSIIKNRYEAVKAAIRFKTDPKTVILIAGKGSESKNIEDGREFHMTDEERVKQACKDLNIYIK
jgi:UDP-N-acetylmuramoyl-L-alanyl-D-glutamate--2,6-diaminopimelate ligase